MAVRDRPFYVTLPDTPRQKFGGKLAKKNFCFVLFPVTLLHSMWDIAHQCMKPANRDHLFPKTAFICTEERSLLTGFIVPYFYERPELCWVAG